MKGIDGTGLGLSITDDIMKAHGGELSVISTSGSGSIFIITLKPRKQNPSKVNRRKTLKQYMLKVWPTVINQL